MYYIHYFFIFAILGHFIETFFTSGFTSGILYGWWTPVYGFGSIIILGIGRLIDTFPLKGKKIFKIILTYLLCMITLSLIELAGGYLIEWIFHQEFWNYKSHRFHIGSYISLEMSNNWGIAGISLLYLLKPIIDKFEKMIPNWLTSILIRLFFLDVIVTIIKKG